MEDPDVHAYANGKCLTHGKDLADCFYQCRIALAETKARAEAAEKDGAEWREAWNVSIHHEREMKVELDAAREALTIIDRIPKGEDPVNVAGWARDQAARILRPEKVRRALEGKG